MTDNTTEQQRIEAGNKLIAIFMGCYPQVVYWGGEPCHRYGFKDISERWQDGEFNNKTPYHEDWNLLMSVVEKIEASADQKTGHITVHIIENNCSMYQFSYIKELTRVYDEKSKIGSVWKAVVQFIEWYNQTKEVGYE